MWINLIVYIILVQLWVAGEKAQPSSGDKREKIPYPSSYCTKSGRMSGVLVSGKNVSITKCIWRHWWRSRSQVSHEPSDILLTCSWVCRGLDGSTCSESLPEGTCHFEPQSTCRGPRPGPKLACGVRAGSLRATEQRAREKTHGRNRKNAEVQKNTFILRT